MSQLRRKIRKATTRSGAKESSISFDGTLGRSFGKRQYCGDDPFCGVFPFVEFNAELVLVCPCVCDAIGLIAFNNSEPYGGPF